jgi:hypothetical protein
MKVLMDFFHSMMRTSEGRLGVPRSVKISYPILVVFRRSPVAIFYFIRSDMSSQVSPTRCMRRRMSRCTDSTLHMLGEPSEGDTRYDLTFLRRRSTRQPNS